MVAPTPQGFGGAIFSSKAIEFVAMQCKPPHLRTQMYTTITILTTIGPTPILTTMGWFTLLVDSNKYVEQKQLFR